jgi:hypothetical protein
MDPTSVVITMPVFFFTSSLIQFQRDWVTPLNVCCGHALILFSCALELTKPLNGLGLLYKTQIDSTILREKQEKMDQNGN